MAPYRNQKLPTDSAEEAHFIGHSHGTLVNAIAIREWGIKRVDHVTLLDPPLHPPEHIGEIDLTDFYNNLEAGRVVFVDHYFAEFGSGPGCTLPTSDAFGIPIKGAAPLSLLQLVQGEDHCSIVDWYRRMDDSRNRGFYYSALLDNFSERPEPKAWDPGGKFAVFARNVTPLLFSTILGNGSFSLITGTAQSTPATVLGQQRANNISMSEHSPTIISADLIIPTEATSMSFDFQFPNAGDGDWLTITFNELPLFNFTGLDFNGSEFRHIEVPVRQIAGQAGVLTATLNSTGNPNAEVILSNFQFLSGSAVQLDVVKTGSGSGTVTSSDGGINCGSTCSESVGSGTQVVLTALPAPNSKLTGWSGGGCGGVGSCTVTVITATTVTATFSQARTVDDFDRDGKTDLAIYRRATGEWFIFGSATGFQTRVFGAPAASGLGDTPVPADFDGDGKTDLAIYRQATGEWFIFGSAMGFQTRVFGAPVAGGLGDTPVPGDFDGDGLADLAIYRKATGEWFIFGSATGFQTRVFGAPAASGLGDTPVQGDFDGDGRADLAIYRRATGEWFIFGSATGFQTRVFGAPSASGLGDTPVPGDFDGDGKTDLAIFRQATGEWFIFGSATGFQTRVFGSPVASGLGDTPVPGDFDGDGLTDLAIYRQATGEWFIFGSATGFQTRVFGAPAASGLGDVPLPQLAH